MTDSHKNVVLLESTSLVRRNGVARSTWSGSLLARAGIYQPTFSSVESEDKLEQRSAGRALARSVGLRYISDSVPGIERRRSGSGFSYWAPDGSRIDDEDELQRIRAIAVPPAYSDVWISPSANGHIQATARDARSRKQYRYHPRWREIRDRTKYDRLLELAAALPRIRQRVAQDLALSGMPQSKVLATIVRLLESTTIRVGNEEYARANDSFGLTTLRNRHVRVNGSAMTFSFPGKSGVRHAISLHDRRLARVVRRCQELPGQRLFEYVVDGEPQAVDSTDVNTYIREIAGDDFTAKDFRTWVGTVTCATILAGYEKLPSQAARKAQISQALELVGRRLGNTATVCRKSYVHPELLSRFQRRGAIGKIRGRPTANGLSPPERFVVRLLRPRTRHT
jgi:DNA topoisomerase-1